MGFEHTYKDGLAFLPMPFRPSHVLGQIFANRLHALAPAQHPYRIQPVRQKVSSSIRISEFIRRVPVASDPWLI